jgi:hypothetical protein
MIKAWQRYFKKHKHIHLAYFLLIFIIISVVYSARLPLVGGDTDQWGTVLNEFLNVSFSENGTLRNNTVNTSNIISSAITAEKLAPLSVNSTHIALNSVNGAQLADTLTLDSGLTISGSAYGLNIETVNVTISGNSTFSSHVGIGISNPTTKLDVNGSFRLGSAGSSTSGIIHGKVDVDPPSIGAASSSSFTITLTGAAVGDLVFLNPPDTLEDVLAYQGANVTGSNTVTIKMRSLATIGNTDGVSRSWVYLLVRP